MQTQPLLKLLPIALVIVLIPMVAFLYFHPRSSQPPRDVGQQASMVIQHQAPDVTVNLPNFASIIADSRAVVVQITVSGLLVAGGEGTATSELEDPFSESMPRFRHEMPAPGRMARGLASGLIISSDGLVMTTAHVVEAAHGITVKLADRSEFKATVLGVDPLSDLAVLKIDANDLPTVPMGDPSRSNVGDWVLAIGSPFGFESTVTAGIISAKHRVLPEGRYVPFIQTDVAVNPGNSGGPLLNVKGEVIGINSQIYSRSGGYQGLSFAVPIDIALRIKDQLVRDGRVYRGRLGVSVQDVDQALADSFGLQSATGALITTVQKDGPAAIAGVRAGDIIVRLNDRPLESSADLPAIMAELKPDTRISASLWRGSEVLTVTVRMTDRVDNDEDPPDAPPLGRNALGLAVRALSEDEARRIDATGGLLVAASVGPAADAGILPGDIILGLNGLPVTKPEDLRHKVPLRSDRIALLIQRGSLRRFVPLFLG